MGGGGGGPTSSTVNQSNLPEYARPYFERMMGRAEAESNQPYVGYGGQRLAGFTPDVQQGFDITRGVAARGTPELDLAGRAAAGSVQAGRPDINASRAITMGSLLGGAQQMQGARDVAFGATGAGAGDIGAARGLTMGALGRGGMETEQNRALAGISAIRGLGAGDYTANAIQQQAFGRDQAQQYMSPYMEEVTARQKAAAVRDFSEGKGARDAAAIRAGAFGGYRSAIQEGVAQRGLGERLSDIEATGRQRAFESAQAQFERDRAASMSAQGTTEAQRLAAAQYGLAGAGLGLQGAQAMGQLTASQQAAGLQGGQAMAQLGSAERDAALRQAGLLGQFASTEQGLGYQGAESLARLGMGQQAAALQQAQTLGQVGSQRQGLTLQQAQALERQGGLQQQQTQRELDMSYQDFLNQRDFERQNINFMSNILRGVPVQPSTVQNTYANPNPLAQFGGLGIAGLGLMRS
jgi:hypothetical protein